MDVPSTAPPRSVGARYNLPRRGANDRVTVPLAFEPRTQPSAGPAPGAALNEGIAEHDCLVPPGPDAHEIDRDARLVREEAQVSARRFGEITELARRGEDL